MEENLHHEIAADNQLKSLINYNRCQLANIKGMRVSELAAIFNLTSATISKQLKTLQLNKNLDRVAEIDSDIIQQYFLKKGFHDLYKTTIHTVAVMAGGAAKTTTAIALLSAARRIKSKSETVINGKKISGACILIDCDPQATSTKRAGIKWQEKNSVLVDYIENRATIKDILVPLGDEIYVIPSSLTNLPIERVLVKPQLIKSTFLRIMNDLESIFGEGFYCVVDTPPALSFSTSSAVIAMSELKNKRDFSVALTIPIRAIDEEGVNGARTAILEAQSIIETYNINSIPISAFLSFYTTAKSSKLNEVSVKLLNDIYTDKIIPQFLNPVVVKYSPDIPFANTNITTLFNGKRSQAAQDYQSLLLDLLGFPLHEETVEQGNA